jgi:dihydrofolate reductase
MGRNTYEFAITIDPWPYAKPVYVLSTSLKPFEDNQKRITVLNKSPAGLVSDLGKKGFDNLYIDGGRTIRGFMADDLIDEWIITRIPVILGSGIPLFGDNLKTQKLVHAGTTTYTSGLVQSRYRRDRKKQRI